MMSLQKPRWDYKWVILVVCFLMEFLCLGFCSSNIGLYTASVTNALNMDRALYSVATSIRYVVQVVAALAFGRMTTRFGLKKMVFVGLLAMIGATVLRATGTVFYHFYIAGALHGLGMVFVGGTMASTIVRRWFHKDIGKYTGIVMSANGIGGAVAAQIITPIIHNGDPFGYRSAYWLSAAVAIGFTVVIMLLLREKAADENTPAPGKKKPKGAQWVGMEYDVVKTKAYFYATAVLVFLTGISLQSIGSITIVYMEDMGMAAGIISAIATISSLSLAVAKFGVGAIFDKRGLRTALLVCQGCALAMFIMKGLLTNSVLGMVLAIVATVLSSAALPLETVMIPLLTNELFGSASYVKALGVFMAMNSLGLCLGTPLGELIRKIFGDYRPCFWLFSVVMVGVIVAFQLVLKAAEKDKEEILSKM